jgi:CDP-4-dehydro-6-deoxyglucose reductase
MPYQVTVKPTNHTFTVNDGETVLDAALREHVVIAYGCRNGACGTCKGKLLAGTLDYGTYQEHALPDAEREAGMALFCQARPLSDLVIECREIAGVKDIQIKMLPCRVQQMQRVAPDVMVLRLKLPTNERLQFLAGQYIDIVKNGARRSFSMANPPHDDAFLELHLRNYGGPFSEHVFTRMKERDILRFEGPFGTFFLREDSAKPIVFVASGTGFAPVKAIIEHALHKGIRRPMTLYWGCRVRADLYLNELAESWQREHGVRYIPVLSDALPTDTWTGRTGFVHRAVMEDFPDLSEHQVYACGAPVMVEAAHEDFTAQCKLPENEFYSDSFTPSVPEKA